MKKGRSLKKALILAGGFGTRIQKISNGRPKPMIPLQGRPIIDYSIELCIRHGISDIAISVHHMAEQIEEYLGDGSQYGVNIIYLKEPTPLGTAGALRLFRDWFDQTFMMCNADELKDIDLHAMMSMHRRSGGLATVALTEVEDPSQYGVVEIHGSRILRFVEKPKPEEAPSNLVNAGLYILEPQAIKRIPKGFAMVEKDLFPQLATEGKLAGYHFPGQWFDTGTPDRYTNAQENWRGFHAAAALYRSDKLDAFLYETKMKA